MLPITHDKIEIVSLDEVFRRENTNKIVTRMSVLEKRKFKDEMLSKTDTELLERNLSKYVLDAMGRNLLHANLSGMARQRGIDPAHTRAVFACGVA